MAITQRTCNTDRMNVYRLAARAFVIGGALFWTLVVFAGGMQWNSARLTESIFFVAPASADKFAAALAYAMIWTAIAAAVFIVGLFWERIAAVMLAAAAVGAIAYGIAKGWETGLWYIVGLFIIVPVGISAVLYLLAAQEQSLCDESAVEPPKAPAQTAS